LQRCDIAAGISGKFSESLFASFTDCVDDARAHGYNHVEVPVLAGHVPAQLPVTTSDAVDIAASDDLDAEDATPFADDLP